MGTAVVVTVNVFVFVFAATVTVAGTTADGSELVIDTTAPDGGAFPFSVRVPVELVPPATLVGLRVREVRAAGVVEITTVFGTAARVAVMVDDLFTATPMVVTVNVAVVAFVATVTLAGTVATVVSELLSATTKLDEPAFPFRVTVPVTFVPPTTGLALRETEVREAAWMVSDPFFVMLL